MKKALIAALLLTSMAFADTAVSPKDFNWPTSTTPFKLVSVNIDCQWVEGRPRALRTDVAKILRLPDEGSNTVDIIEVLTEKGWLVRLDHDGQIQATNPNAAAKAAGPVNANVRAQNAQANANYEIQKAGDEKAAAMAPKLKWVLKRVYIADTEYIRADVVVKNVGGSANEACTAVGDFVDWYEHPFAQHKLPLGPLQPGQSQEFTFFSLIHKDDQNPNLVIKADKYTLKVRFE